MSGLAKPYPYVIEAIEHLANIGKGLAISSSRSHASLQEFVDQMQLTDKFAMLVGGNDVIYGKPYKLRLSLEGAAVNGSGKVITLSSSSPKSENTIDCPDNIRPTECEYDSFSENFLYEFVPLTMKLSSHVD